MKIIENVFLVPGVNANPYLLVDPDELALIDAGMPGSEEKILAYIAGLGRAPSNLKRILLTHSDLDHIGALAALQQATGARVYASAIEAQAIAKGVSSKQMDENPEAAPVHVDEILTDGQILPILGGLRVVETSGHSPGHVSFFAPAAGILFCGDSMVSKDGLQGSVPVYTWDVARAEASVRKQAVLSPRIVCSGHGPPVYQAAEKMPRVFQRIVNGNRKTSNEENFYQETG